MKQTIEITDIRITLTVSTVMLMGIAGITGFWPYACVLLYAASLCIITRMGALGVLGLDKVPTVIGESSYIIDRPVWGKPAARRDDTNTMETMNKVQAEIHACAEFVNIDYPEHLLRVRRNVTMTRRFQERRENARRCVNAACSLPQCCGPGA